MNVHQVVPLLLPATELSEPDPVVSTGMPPGDFNIREFRFVVENGREIIATTRVGSPGTSKWSVVFSPFLNRTDGNVYNAALHCLWNLYGTERGLFQFEEAELRADPDLGGQAICWPIGNPAGEFCISPIRDETTGRIVALTVWVQ